MGKNTHDVLRKVVAEVKGMPGWSFHIVDEDGDLRLVIRVWGENSACPEKHERYGVDNYFPVPAATYNERTWRRWVFEMSRRTMNHELGEWTRWGDLRPFAPLHGPGEDPYTVHEFRPPIDQFVTQDGTIREPYIERRDPYFTPEE